MSRVDGTAEPMLNLEKRIGSRFVQRLAILMAKRA
jgi:hypothetical protein